MCANTKVAQDRWEGQEGVGPVGGRLGMPTCRQLLTHKSAPRANGSGECGGGESTFAQRTEEKLKPEKNTLFS